jgi:hypothetical protein
MSMGGGHSPNVKLNLDIASPEAPYLSTLFWENPHLRAYLGIFYVSNLFTFFLIYIRYNVLPK